MFTKRKISFKIAVSTIFTFLTIIVISVVNLNFYFHSDEAVLKLTDRIADEIGEKITERTNHYLQDPAEHLALISINFLSGKKNIMEDHQNTWKYMWSALLNFRQVQSFFVGDKDGNFIQAIKQPFYATRYIDRTGSQVEEKWFYRDSDYKIIQEIEEKSLYDPRIRPWYKNTKPKEQIYWTDVYPYSFDGNLGITASYPVVHRAFNGEKELSAVVSVDIPLSKISEFIQQQEISANGLILIINEKYKADGTVTTELIAHPERSLLTKNIFHKDGTKEIILSNITDIPELWARIAIQAHIESKSNRFIFNNNEKQYSVNIIPFTAAFESNWKLFIIIPKEDLTKDIQESIWQALWISFGITLFAIIIIYLITSKIGSSLNRLAYMTNTIKDFELEKFTGIKSWIKEIHTINNAITNTVQGLKAFQKYVPADLVRELIRNEDEAMLGGKRKELTIFFTDIQGFTNLSEQLAPQVLMNHLSEYLDQLSKIIIAEKGTIDKYIGDAIMAFWGAPTPIADMAYRACSAALFCQSALKDLNAKWINAGLPPMYTRIGIHTGETIVGNIGSDKRMNYTVIGDNVNLASRLEGANKQYGTQIIISEATYQQIAKDFLCRPLDIIAVKGKTTGTPIYELVGSLKKPVLPEVEQFCKYFELGFQFYLQKNWAEAIVVFKTLQKYYSTEKSLELYLQRCHYFQSNPHILPADWDGVIQLDSK